MKNIIFDLYGTLIDLWTNENRNNFWERLAIKARKYHKYEYKELRRKYIELCSKYSKKYEEIELLDVFSDLYGKENKYTGDMSLTAGLANSLRAAGIDLSRMEVIETEKPPR